MAVFLNREGILKHFDRLFEKAKKEIIMVVPFIQLSNDTLEKFKKAHSNKIEIVIVYRENKLNQQERDKLLQFDNITLMHHPNVHAKCYLNEESIIVCSMNLYEHSMKNNREMGVLLDFFEQEEIVKTKGLSVYTSDDSESIKNALEEIRLIIQASTIERKSLHFSSNGFNLELLKTKLEHYQELLGKINSWSENKVFGIKISANGEPSISCKNYYENLDLHFDINTYMSRTEGICYSLKRVVLELKHPDAQVLEIKNHIDTPALEFRFKYFKTYFPHKNAIMLYRDSKNFNDLWDNVTEEQLVRAFIKGCNKIITELKEIKAFQKIK